MPTCNFSELLSSRLGSVPAQLTEPLCNPFLAYVVFITALRRWELAIPATATAATRCRRRRPLVDDWWDCSWKSQGHGGRWKSVGPVPDAVLDVCLV